MRLRPDFAVKTNVMTHHIRSILALPILTVLVLPVPAMSEPESQDGWRWTLQGAFVNQFDAGLDDDGEVGIERYYTSVRVSRNLTTQWRVSAELGYGEDNYSFSGNSGFGGMDPWRAAREVRLSLPIQYVTADRWSFFAVPSLRFNAEDGASLEDGQTAGLLAGAIYRVSDSLSIGPGFGAYTEIEDDASFFPMLLIDWQLTDDLSLQTGGGFAASRGPGLQLKWKAHPQWQFSFGGRYEKTRFRLDDSGIAPDGVAQEKGFPLYALAEYVASNDVKVSLIGGAKVGGKLRLDDASGGLVSETDMDTAPFFGAMFQATF